MIPLIVALAAGATPAPFFCPAPDADRGPVPTGPPLPHTFRFVNPPERREVVALTLGGTECGCLSRRLSRRVLNPGESADLDVAVNTLTRPAGPNTWETTLSYTVSSAAGGLVDGPHPLTLCVRATLVPAVTVDPPQVAFSTAGAARQTLTVSDRRPSPLRILRAATSTPDLVITLGREVTTAGVRSMPVEVAVGADAPAGDRDEVVTLATDDPGCPELRVPVRLSKRPAGAAVATPAAVNLRFAPGQTELSAVVQVRRPDGRPVAITGANPDDAAVSVHWQPTTGPVAAVRVRVRAAVAGGRAVVRIVLADVGEVAVPVEWAVP